MAKLVVHSLKQQVNKIVLVQCAIVLLLAIVFFLTSGYRAALAVVCGGLVNILPSYCYAARLFANVSPHAIVRIMCVFYIGEVLKLVISIVMFIVLLMMFRFPLLPYFLGYLVAALTFCIAPFWIMNKQTKVVETI